MKGHMTCWMAVAIAWTSFAVTSVTPWGYREEGQDAFSQDKTGFNPSDSITLSDETTDSIRYDAPAGMRVTSWYYAKAGDLRDGKWSSVMQLHQANTNVLWLSKGDADYDMLKGAGFDPQLLVERAYVRYDLHLDGREAARDVVYTNKIVLQEATQTGYQFEGWTNSVGRLYAAGEEHPVTGADFGVRSEDETVDLYSKFTALQYDVTLIDGEGASGGSGGVRVTFDGTLPDVNVPVRAGYDFLGYFTEQDGRGTKCYDESGKGVIIWKSASGAQLYAGWKLKNRYYLTLNPNADEFTAITYTCTNGVPFSLPRQPWTIPGRTFLGWARLPTLTSPEFADQATIDGSQWEITKDLEEHVLYAVWSYGILSVTFDVNGGEALAPEERNKEFKASFTYLYSASFPEPVRNGFAFAGWWTQAEGGDQVEETDMVSTTGACTYYAHWIDRQYTIRFEGNGATSGTMEKLTAEKGESVELPSNAFLRTGYVFQGWGTNGVTSVVFTNRATVVDVASPGETNVFSAVWAPISYKVMFASNGGSGAAMGDVVVSYDEEIALPPCAYQPPDPELQAFAGWRGEDGVVVAAGALVSNLCTVADDTYTYQAEWRLSAGGWSEALHCSTLRWSIANADDRGESWQTNVVPAGAWQKCEDRPQDLWWLTAAVTNSGSLRFKCKVNKATSSKDPHLRIGFSKSDAIFADPSDNHVDILAKDLSTEYGERSVRVELPDGADKVFIHLAAMWPVDGEVIYIDEVEWVPDGGNPDPGPGDAVRISSASASDGVFTLSFDSDARFDYNLLTNANLQAEGWNVMETKEGDGKQILFEAEILPEVPQMFYKVETIRKRK